MSHDARCDEHQATNGRHYLSFTVLEPADRPETFELQPSPLEYERLKEHSTGESGVGTVPLSYDEGWEIDWEALEAETS